MKRDCSNCGWAEWEKFPSGRKNYHKGECTYEVKLPMSYRSLRGDMPYKSSIYKNFIQLSSDRFMECQCWKSIKKKNKGAYNSAG